jgi:hypothetical protein
MDHIFGRPHPWSAHTGLAAVVYQPRADTSLDHYTLWEEKRDIVSWPRQRARHPLPSVACQTLW